MSITATTPITGAVWTTTGFGAGSDFGVFTPAEVLSSVRAHRRIRVECTASAASAKELVMELQQVRDPVLDEHILFFDFLGTNDELAAIPAVLLENGIRFSSFSEQGINLEDLFLEITTGDIQ